MSERRKDDENNKEIKDLKISPKYLPGEEHSMLNVGALSWSWRVCRVCKWKYKGTIWNGVQNKTGTRDLPNSYELNFFEYRNFRKLEKH